MSQPDLKKAELVALGYSGSLQDMEMEWLTDEGFLTGTLLDRWKAMLAADGHTGSLNDALYGWLGEKGYTGGLDKRINDALVATNFYVVIP